MTRPEQQQTERRFLDATIVSLHLDLAGDPLMNVPPLPDFTLVLADGRRIGVELTEARDSDVAAAWNGARRRLEMAVEAALARDSANASVSGYLHVESLVELERRRVALHETADKIAELARASLPTGMEPSKHAVRKAGINFLRWIAVTPAPRPQVSFVVSALPAGPQLVQGAIDIKVPKLDAYRQLGADEYWLLVIGGEPMSGYVTLGDVEGLEFQSPFDRTVFLDRAARACVDLCTVTP